MDDIVKAALAWSLNKTEGNQRAAARQLGMCRSTFRERLVRHGII